MDDFDVPDPTDWQNTPLASLEHVEQALRCHVCKDFFEAPMLTSCNHTFCSLCIRRCLAADGKCPLCRATEQEARLRGNWALREAVEAFVKARDGLLNFAKTPTPAAGPALNSPKRKARELDESDEGDSQGTKRLRTSARLSRAKGAQATAAIMVEEAADSDASDDALYEPEPDDGLVACPICLSRMKAWQVDKHIDTSCPGSPPAKPHAARTSRNNANRSDFHSSPDPAKAPERLPSLAYSMLKDYQLRKKMSDLGIPTHGPRQALEKRHQEFVTLWNANCDSAHPKNRSELLHDLDVWERTIGSRAPATSKAAAVGAQIKDKNFDGAAWAARHGDSFKNLIANARKTKMQTQPTPKLSSHSEIVPGSDIKGGQEPGLNFEPQPPFTDRSQPQHSSAPSQQQTNGQPENRSQELPFSGSELPQTTLPQHPAYSGDHFYRQNSFGNLGADQSRQAESTYQGLEGVPKASSSQPSLPSVSSSFTYPYTYTPHEMTAGEVWGMRRTDMGVSSSGFSDMPAQGIPSTTVPVSDSQPTGAQCQGAPLQENWNHGGPAPPSQD
ncbi:hypothetical protein QBC37DRAFT_412230 [Rhypophila decipiens]|uniref:Postreplication repair E3 ubiquitin-protein ligase RAD18 n=1 Tax=Rhypophila decipiens TaxID=261697 RepID=A0AAN6YHC6_9PEZI|nr:hypothetical protein QBC37DRAFT_412230 [Rhypophila decipiens]